jgi:cytochrome P450
MGLRSNLHRIAEGIMEMRPQATPEGNWRSVPSQLIIAARNRSHYARQGIDFGSGMGPFEVERTVSRLLQRSLTRDHMIEVSDTDDFVGSWRGFRVQLYATSRSAVEALVHPSVVGDFIDRDTPARHSIGQLTPNAITFTSTNAIDFHIRKRNILRATDSSTSSDARSSIVIPADDVCPMDIRPRVTEWAQATMGAIVWGRHSVSAPVMYETAEATLEQMPFGTALYDTFTRLRRHSNKLWARIHPTLASAPLTAEIRRLQRNIDILQRHADYWIDQADDQTIAGRLSALNKIDGVSTAHTRDDVMTCFLAGTDTLRTALLASLWHLLHPDNAKWRLALTSSDACTEFELARACVFEALRLTTPGSVFNGRVVQDFNVETTQRTYRLRKDTLVMPSVHAIHARYGSVFDPGRLLDASARERPLVIPFGKGVRSCPGRNFATRLMIGFLTNFLRENPNIQLADILDAPTFNTTSTTPLWIHHADNARGTVVANDESG